MASKRQGPNGGAKVLVEKLRAGDRAFLDHALRVVEKLEVWPLGPVVTDSGGRRYYFPSGLRVERMRP